MPLRRVFELREEETGDRYEDADNLAKVLEESDTDWTVSREGGDYELYVGYEIDE